MAIRGVRDLVQCQIAMPRSGMIRLSWPSPRRLSPQPEKATHSAAQATISLAFIAEQNDHSRMRTRRDGAGRLPRRSADIAVLRDGGDVTVGNQAPRLALAGTEPSYDGVSGDFPV